MNITVNKKPSNNKRKNRSANKKERDNLRATTAASGEVKKRIRIDLS